MKKKEKRKCHGCGGKGWVPVGGKAQRCPVCGGSGDVMGDPLPYYKNKWTMGRKGYVGDDDCIKRHEWRG